MFEIETNPYILKPKELRSLYRFRKRRLILWATVGLALLLLVFIAVSAFMHFSLGDSNFFTSWGPLALALTFYWTLIVGVVPYSFSMEKSQAWERGTDFHALIDSEFVSLVGSDGSGTKNKLTTL